MGQRNISNENRQLAKKQVAFPETQETTTSAQETAATNDLQRINALLDKNSSSLRAGSDEAILLVKVFEK